MATRKRLEPDDMIERVVRRGVLLAKFALEPGTMTVGGIPKDKTRTQRRDEMIRLKQVAEVLDLMQWYGEWGQTPHGIEMELIRMAKVEGA